MKKTLQLLLAIVFTNSVFAQEALYDKWQSVYTFSITSSIQDYKKSVTIEDKVVMIIDTFSGGNSTFSGLYTYDINTRAIGNIPFTLASGDRGIACATAYKTSTPGTSYGVFGCYSSPDVGGSYPVVYTYSSLSNTITADSITAGTVFQFDGGIRHIAMFSPTTDNDTMRVFSVYNLGISVFKKHINQTGFVSTSSVVPIDYIYSSIIFNNKLYLAGSYNNEPALIESTDGNTFTPVSGFIPSNFAQYTYVNNMDTLNGELYYSISEYLNGYKIFKYNTTTHSSIYQTTGSEFVTNLKSYKDKIWFSTVDNASNSSTASIYHISNSVIDSSANRIGYEDVDGNNLSFASTIDSLYFIGNKGTYYASKGSNGNSAQKQLINRYLNVWKLMPPVASFNYNNNQICLNASETFTSTSQNTDSLHWLKDGILYASSPGSTAWMNYNFGTTGTHTVGLVAFGGTLSDTSFLSVNVYSISAAITGQTLVCLGNSFVMTSTVTGAVGTPTLGWRDNISSPTTDLGVNSSLTYSPTTGGNVYEFYLNVTDAHGCSATSNTINAQCNPLYQIEGQALTGITPTITPVSGAVTLFKYEPFLGRFDSISTSVIDVAGNFNFAAIAEGDYILKATPSASSLQITYYGDTALTWKSALPFSHTCLNQSTKNIDVIPLVNAGGPGQLSGIIIKAQGFQGQRFAQTSNNELKPLVPGQPIGGIIVKGGRNPGGQMFTQTITAANGTYTLSGLPISTDNYFIVVDIPGLDTNGTYHPFITVGTTTITGLDFTVDSIYINPQGLITSLKNETSILNNEIKLYPNPTKTSTNIQFELIRSATVTIELFDVIGRKTETVIPKNEYSIGLYNKQINTESLSAGIYFIKLTINNSETVIKLITTN